MHGSSFQSDPHTDVRGVCSVSRVACPSLPRSCCLATTYSLAAACLACDSDEEERLEFHVVDLQSDACMVVVSSLMYGVSLLPDLKLSPA